jgi:hypothetical protein
MSPNLPRQDVKNARPRSLLTIVVVALLVLLGLYVFKTYFMEDSDPDRPVIIISSSSVLVKSGGEWIDEGGKGYKQDFKGKSVKSFLAVTSTIGSACTVQGKTIIVTYGSDEITFTRKRKWPWNKHGAFAQFPAAATVNPGGAGELVVTTDDALVSFRDEKGDSCDVAGGTLTIYQLH